MPAATVKYDNVFFMDPLAAYLRSRGDHPLHPLRSRPLAVRMTELRREIAAINRKHDPQT